MPLLWGGPCCLSFPELLVFAYFLIVVPTRLRCCRGRRGLHRARCRGCGRVRCRGHCSGRLRHGHGRDCGRGPGHGRR